MAIKFPENIVEEAWHKSERQCQCTRSSHYHGPNRCKIKLYKPSRNKDTRMAWVAYPKNPEGSPTLSNCEIICHACYNRIRMYGN